MYHYFNWLRKRKKKKKKISFLNTLVKLLKNKWKQVSHLEFYAFQLLMTYSVGKTADTAVQRTCAAYDFHYKGGWGERVKTKHFLSSKHSGGAFQVKLCTDKDLLSFIPWNIVSKNFEAASHFRFSFANYHVNILCTCLKKLLLKWVHSSFFFFQIPIN